MEKKWKSYESPTTEVVEMKMQGMLCDSKVDLSIMLLSDYGQDAGNTEGFVW